MFYSAGKYRNDDMTRVYKCSYVVMVFFEKSRCCCNTATIFYASVGLILKICHVEVIR